MAMWSGSGRVWSPGLACLPLLAALAVPATVQAQTVELQGVEFAPFVGTRFGGTFDVQTDQQVQSKALLQDGSSYGFSAGVRFDDFSLIEFRWTRSMSGLHFGAPLAQLGPAIGNITLNQFHADFTREFPLSQVKGLRAFLSGSVGATHMSAMNEGFTRFSFGLGTGLKQFLTSRLAIRGEVHWLPILIAPEVGGFACGAIGPGGCLLVLDGRRIEQFELSVGPTIRF